MKNPVGAILLSLPLLVSAVTVDSLLSEALANNPQIRAVREQSKAAEQQIEINGAIPDPVVSGGYFIKEVETRVGPQKGKVGVSQMLPWPGKIIAKKDVAESGYSISLTKVRGVESNVVAQVRKAWIGLYITGKSIELKQESDRLLAHQQEVLTVRYATGKVPQSALLKIDVARAKLGDDILSLESEGVRIREQLRSLLNRQSADFTWPTDLYVLNESDSLSTETILAGSPLLGMKTGMAEMADVKISAAKQQFAPNFMVMTDYIFTDETDNAMVSPEENGKDPWVVGASVTLPLWAGSKSAGVKKAEREAQARQEDVSAMRLQLERELVSLRETIEDAERKVKLYEETVIPRAEQTLALVEEEYRQNRATVLDYLDAQKTLLDLELMLIKQQARRELAVVDIYRIAGDNHE